VADVLEKFATFLRAHGCESEVFSFRGRKPSARKIFRKNECHKVNNREFLSALSQKVACQCCAYPYSILDL
jgi:hypothetical protein